MFLSSSSVLAKLKIISDFTIFFTLILKIKVLLMKYFFKKQIQDLN